MAEEHIKINPVPTKVKYSGNGVVKEFPTGFAFFENDNIVVYHNGKIINTGYSITGVGETGGGKVIFNVAPATGDKIIILRKVVVERVTDFQEGGTFRAKNINDELDRQTAFCQQIQEEMERCVKVEVTDDQSPEELLAEVYNKLDSATEVAEQAIGAANQATTAAKNANDAVIVAQQQITETQAFIEQARADINQTVEDSIEYVEQEAVKAATEVVGEVVGQYTERAETAAVSAEADANSASASAASASANAIKAETNADEVAVYNFKNKITNCITEIPQDIKLELNNGTLTLKAGSKVYVPNGAGKFDEVVVSSDRTTTGFVNGEGLVFYNRATNNFTIYGTNRIYSGTSAPTGILSGNNLWYNTTDNKIKQTTNGGTSWADINISLPMAKITGDSSKLTSIDQVFNGFGYIGSTVFALPNVKGLIPNGRNADGSLKNIEAKLTKVITRTFATNVNSNNLILPITASQQIGSGIYVLNDRESILYETSSGVKYADRYVAMSASISAGVITSFTPKLPFRAVDQNDFNKLDEEVVKTSGDQTIAGVKTFTSSPKVPTPSASDNSILAATTAWVNNALRGSLMAYAGATAPTGWLKCDGSAVSRTTYSALFAIIGTTYGGGNGSTTFNLPNFVNKTFWGGTGKATSLSQTLPNIKGTFAGGIGDKATATGAFTRTGTDTESTKVDAVGDSSAYSGLFSFNANRSNSVYQDGAVVRPNVIQTLICIKY